MRLTAFLGCTCVLMLVGCGRGPDSTVEVVRTDAKPDVAENEPLAEAPAEAAPAEQEGVGTKLKKSLSSFGKSAEDAASGVSEFAGETLDGLTSTGAKAMDSVGSATDDAMDYVTGLYQSAKKNGETKAGSAQDWIMDDWKKGGTWQYKVLTLPATAKNAEAELNKLGKSRWECYSVVADGETRTYHFKRATQSVIRNLPAKELFRLLPLLGGGDEE